MPQHWQERDAQDYVVVAQAENDLGRVQRSLSTPKAPEKAVVRDSDSIDLEKGRNGNRQETFDLRGYLTSSNDATSAAGIKHKHVGVTWEDLEVSGIGGEENEVCSLSSLIICSVSPHALVRSTSPHTQVGDFLSFPASFPDSLGRCGHRSHHFPLCRSSQRAPTNPPKETAAVPTRQNNYSQVRHLNSACFILF